MNKLQRLVLLVLVLLPAFWLRLFLLDGQSLWWDEGISLHLATSSFGEIIANRITNIHPPLYFFLLKIWVSLTGTTVFAARYSSVLGSFLQMALVYAVLRRWFGRRTAAIGLLLTAVWSMSIIYAQEVRVYAFLPLVYLLLLLLTYDVGMGEPYHQTWLALGVAEWVALHLHYNLLFLLVFLNGWLVVKLWPKSRLWPWLKVQLGVALASLPWALGVLLNWPAVQAEASLAGFSTQPPAWDFVLPQVWGFHVTGLVNVLGDPLVRPFSIVLLALMVFLLLGQWLRRRWHGSAQCADAGPSAGTLLLFWLAPLFLGFTVWLVRSYSHPRYIALFAAGLVLLLAFLLTPRRLVDRGAAFGNLLRAGTAVCFVWLSGWGLQHYFFSPDFAKDNMQGVAKLLEDVATPADLILVPRTDWSLPFTYAGETPIRMADTFHQEEMWADLAAWTTPPAHVFTLDYDEDLYDWQGVVPFALESAGELVRRWRVDDLTLSQYRLESPVARPELQSQDGRFGELALRGSWVVPTATTADGVTVALQWQLLAPVTHNYAIVLSVDDGTGLEFANRDDQLVTPGGRPTNLWDVGEIVTTYHFLPFVKGTPPVKYEVDLRAYIFEGEIQTLDYIDRQGRSQGQALVLGEVQVERPLPDQAHVYGAALTYPPLPEPIRLADGLLLTHTSLERSQIAPGQILRVRLGWQSSAILPDLRPRLVLRQGEEELVGNDSAPVQGVYPTNLWRPDEFIWEQRLLTVPATAESGTAALWVELGEQSYQLGEVEISAEVRLFEPPAPQVAVDAVFGDVARLVGFDPPPENVPAGQPVPLTLYWQSLQTGEPVGYTVFTQVLGENGRVIAQHDSPPANGRRPTPGWVEGEYIQDEHLLAVGDHSYTGEGQLIVGLYDPTTGARLTLPDGRDAFPLHVPLTVGGE